MVECLSLDSSGIHGWRMDQLLHYFLMQKFKCFITLHGGKKYLNADWMWKKAVVDCLSRRPKLITLIATLIVLDIAQTYSNNCFIIQWTEIKWSRQEVELIIYFLTCKNIQATQIARNWLPFEIMHCGHTWHDYPWPWVTLKWLLYNLQLDDVPGTDFENSLYALDHSGKR